jgi:hypothetical protein
MLRDGAHDNHHAIPARCRYVGSRPECEWWLHRLLGWSESTCTDPARVIQFTDAMNRLSRSTS